MTPTLPSLGIGIVTYNSMRHIDRCLESVLTASEGLDTDLVVVDNASTDGTPQHLREHWAPLGVRIILREENVGYAGGVNTIARSVHGDVIAFLNPDLTLNPDTIRKALEYLAANPQVGLVGGDLHDLDGISTMVYGALPTPWRLHYAYSGLRRIWLNPSWDMGRGLSPGMHQPFGVGYPCGAMWFVRREAWNEVGPFDERYFLYFEETDWATRCHKTHWKVMVNPAIVATHEGAGSTPKDLEAQTMMFARFFRSAFQYLAKHFGVRAARRTYRQMLATLHFKQALLELFAANPVRESQVVIRSGMERNETFVMGPDLSGDPTLVLRPPSPAEEVQGPACIPTAVASG